jgi:hypothetical protein
MIRGFSLAPWMTIIPFFLHTFILLHYVWRKYSFAESLKKQGAYFLSTKQRFSGWRTVYFVFGIYFIDTCIKMVFGIFGIENWTFIIPSAILFLIVGFEYVFRAVFKAPNRYDLKSAFTVIFVSVIILEVYLPRSADLMISIASLLIPFIVAWLLFGPLCRLRIRYLERTGRTDELTEVYASVYDIQTKFYKIFTPIADIIIWIILFIDVVLRFEGFSFITIFL